jgi:hypothetical protein
METQFTSEMLKTIYDMTISYMKAKHDIDPDSIRIDEYGNIEAVYERYLGCGDYENETYLIDADELNNMDLDELTRQRLEKAEKEKLERIERQKKEEEQRQRREKEQRKTQYLKLKQEFEQ